MVLSFSCKPEASQEPIGNAEAQIGFSRLLRNSSVIFGGRLVRLPSAAEADFKQLVSESSPERQDSLLQVFLRNAPDSALKQWRDLFALAETKFLEAEKKEASAFAALAHNPDMQKAVKIAAKAVPPGMKSYAAELSFEDKVRYIVLGYNCYNQDNSQKPICTYEQNIKQKFILKFQNLEQDSLIAPFFEALRNASIKTQSNKKPA